MQTRHISDNKRLSALIEYAYTKRNKAYFIWLWRASDAAMMKRPPPLDIDIHSLTDAERDFYEKHLRTWLKAKHSQLYTQIYDKDDK